MPAKLQHHQPSPRTTAPERRVPGRGHAGWWAILLAALLLAAPGSGWVAELPAQALQFEATEIEHAPEPADEQVTVVYRYRNTAAHPVRFTGGETNCDCLKAEPDKLVLQPGETGELKALFALGSMVGRQRQRVTLLTEESGRAHRYDLFVIMDIPILVRIEPEVMRWTVGSEPEPQVFDLRMTGEEPLNVTAVDSTRPGFEWELETVEQGRRYRLKVSPDSTARPTMGAMRIETDSPVPKYQRALAYFTIQPPGREEAGEGR